MKIRGYDMGRKFRCAKCGYLTQRQSPPRVCPMCKAGSEAFDDIGVNRSSEKKRFLTQN